MCAKIIRYLFLPIVNIKWIEVKSQLKLFSFHELGVYDLPATIDHVLKVTRREKLLYIGHSQGSTQFWVMTSVRPEYNEKVALAIGLAPAAFTGNLRGPITQLARLTYFGVVGHANIFLLVLFFPTRLHMDVPETRVSYL